MDPFQIREVVENVTQEANRIWGISMPVPRVTFFHRGRTAGWAKYHLHEVSFNSVLARENPNTFKNTVIHEVAHLVTYRLHPTAKAHGPEFKNVFIRLGGNGKRCHNYDVTSTRVKKTITRYEVKCSCQTHLVTKKSVVLALLNRLVCRKCKGMCAPTGNAKKIK